MGEGARKKGGWKLETQVFEVISAQVNATYAVAVQLADWEVMPTSLALDKLNRKVLNDLIQKTVWVHEEDLDHSLRTRVTISFFGNTEDVVEMVKMPRSVPPKLKNKEIEERREALLARLMDKGQWRLILGRSNQVAS